MSAAAWERRPSRTGGAVLGVAVTALLAITALVYWPGLSGPFLFDDAANLSPLSRADGGFTIGNLAAYLESGWTGPTGRPLSLATFFLNAQDWPADPWWFKFTNLCLHLCNGLLVLVLANQLLRLVGRSVAEARWMGLAMMGVWLVHPIHVSTVLYVSQRMTELAALFTLLGLIGYVTGRQLAAVRPWPGYALMGLAIGLGTLLATYSKEIGVLLPVYALVLELTLLAGSRCPGVSGGPWRLWRALVVYLPCIGLAAYFAWRWGWVLETYEIRHFTLTQRLLTEPRVLFDYVGSIFMPWRVEGGLYHDDFALSTGWLSPSTTLISILALAAVFLGALILRRKAPMLAFGVLWFLAGHALESSFLGIDLYFEHRNYLPLFGPVFAATYGLLVVVPSPRMMAGALAVGLILLGEAVPAYRLTTLWADYGQLAEYWAGQSPASRRAQQVAANHWLKQGRHEQAHAALAEAVRRNPDEIGVALQLVNVECAMGVEVSLDSAALVHRAQIGQLDGSIYVSLDQLLQAIRRAACAGLGLSDIYAIERALIENPRYASGRAQARLHYDLALTLAAGKRLPMAIEAAKASFRLQRDSEVAVELARWLYLEDRPADALSYLERARAVEARRSGQNLKEKTENLDRLERLIREQLQEKGSD